MTFKRLAGAAGETNSLTAQQLLAYDELQRNFTEWGERDKEVDC